MLRKGAIPTIFGRPENMLTTNTESVRFRNDPENMDIVPKTEPLDESYADPLAMAAALKFVAFNFNLYFFFIRCNFSNILFSSASEPYQMPEGQTQSIEYDCRGCTKLHIELLKALERINSLEESLHNQGIILAKKHYLLASFKEENGKLKAERNKWRCNNGQSATANSIN